MIDAALGEVTTISWPENEQMGGAQIQELFWVSPRQEWLMDGIEMAARIRGTIRWRRDAVVACDAIPLRSRDPWTDAEWAQPHLPEPSEMDPGGDF